MAFVRPEQTVIVNTLRYLLREQMQTCWMNKDAVRFITENKLVRVTEWPGFVIHLTDAGAEYLRENSH